LRIRKGLSERIFDAVVVLIALAISFVTLYPFVYVLFASLSDAGDLMSHGGFLWKPYGFHLDAYFNVFKNPNILIGFKNTLFILVAGVAVHMFLTAMAAYVLSRKQVYWNRLMIFFVLLTMFFSGGLIPLYLVVKQVGLLNSLWSLIIPFSVNTFNLLIMRTSFMAIPDSLEESAKIDGANHFVIFARIVVPLSMPVIAVMILYYSVEKWNAWFYASVFLNNRELFPIQLILREILISGSMDSMTSGADVGQMQQIAQTIKYATIIVATLPILVVYPFLQKYFVKGVMVGAVKG
jgi:putative aldouronate transport system permease protein